MQVARSQVIIALRMAGSPAARLSVAGRLERLPLSRFHRRIVTLIALGGWFDFYDIFMVAYLGAALRDAGLLVLGGLSRLSGGAVSDPRPRHGGRVHLQLESAERGHRRTARVRCWCRRGVDHGRLDRRGCNHRGIRSENQRRPAGSRVALSSPDRAASWPTSGSRGGAH